MSQSRIFGAIFGDGLERFDSVLSSVSGRQPGGSLYGSVGRYGQGSQSDTSAVWEAHKI